MASLVARMRPGLSYDQTRLGRLPADIRMKIYVYVLTLPVHKNSYISPYVRATRVQPQNFLPTTKEQYLLNSTKTIPVSKAKWRTKSRPCLVLLQTCQRVYLETYQIFFSVNKIAFTYREFEEFCESGALGLLRPRNLHSICILMKSVYSPTELFLLLSKVPRIQKLLLVGVKPRWLRRAMEDHAPAAVQKLQGMEEVRIFGEAKKKSGEKEMVCWCTQSGVPFSKYQPSWFHYPKSGELVAQALMLKSVMTRPVSAQVELQIYIPAWMKQSEEGECWDDPHWDDPQNVELSKEDAGTASNEDGVEGSSKEIVEKRKREDVIPTYPGESRIQTARRILQGATQMLEIVEDLYAEGSNGVAGS